MPSKRLSRRFIYKHPLFRSLFALAVGLLLVIPSGAQTVQLRDYQASSTSTFSYFMGTSSSWSTLRWTNNVGGIATNFSTQTYTYPPPAFGISYLTVTVWTNATGGYSDTTPTVQGSPPYWWYFMNGYVYGYIPGPVHQNVTSPPTVPSSAPWPHTFSSTSFMTNNGTSTSSSTAIASIDLLTGGPTNSTASALFKLHFSGTHATNGQAITDYPNVTLLGGHPDANGDTYIVLGDNSTNNVTPDVTSHNNYTFTVTAQRGGVDLGVNGMPEATEENPGVHMCVDQIANGFFSINSLGLPGTWRFTFNTNLIYVIRKNSDGTLSPVNSGEDYPAVPIGIGVLFDVYSPSGAGSGSTTIVGTFTSTAPGVNVSLSDSVKITVHEPQSATATSDMLDPWQNEDEVANQVPPITIAWVNAELHVCLSSITLTVKIDGKCVDGTDAEARNFLPAPVWSMTNSASPTTVITGSFVTVPPYATTLEYVHLRQRWEFTTGVGQWNPASAISGTVTVSFPGFPEGVTGEQSSGIDPITGDVTVGQFTAHSRLYDIHWQVDANGVPTVQVSQHAK